MPSQPHAFFGDFNFTNRAIWFNFFFDFHYWHGSLDSRSSKCRENASVSCVTWYLLYYLAISGPLVPHGSRFCSTRKNTFHCLIYKRTTHFNTKSQLVDVPEILHRRWSYAFMQLGLWGIYWIGIHTMRPILSRIYLFQLSIFIMEHNFSSVCQFYQTAFGSLM